MKKFVDYKKIAASVCGRTFFDFKASLISHYRIGGPIDLLVYPKTVAECQHLIMLCNQEDIPYFLFGKGTNLLISDGGFRGVFILLDDCSMQCAIRGTSLYVGAAMVLWNLIQKTMDEGLGDMSNMSWIPGTVGGALFMNAGAFGTEIETFVENVDVITHDGTLQKVLQKECQFSYRKSDLQDKIILGANLKLTEKSRKEMKENSRRIIQRRKLKQPLEYPSCGSVFKRPKGSYAGALIESCGLKGFSIGGAEVSQKHANFILNKKKATAKDVYSIIQHIQKTVQKEQGVTLEREVKLIGFGDESG